MAGGLLDELVDALRILPGVGPKSAQRIALHLLQRDRKGAARLGDVMSRAVENIQHCTQCRIFTENALCDYCNSDERDATQLCVVENPADVLAIDKSTAYQGQFFLLLGHLSPLDGVGPKELGLDLLEARLNNGDIKELTLAMNSTIEGQATARYITKMANDRNVVVLQIARGIPIGSDLEFADSGTLSIAFEQRTPL